MNFVTLKKDKFSMKRHKNVNVWVDIKQRTINVFNNLPAQKDLLILKVTVTRLRQHHQLSKRQYLQIILHRVNKNNHKHNKNLSAHFLHFTTKQQNVVHASHHYILIKQQKNVFLADKIKFIIWKQNCAYVWMVLLE